MCRAHAGVWPRSWLHLHQAAAPELLDQEIEVLLDLFSRCFELVFEAVHDLVPGVAFPGQIPDPAAHFIKPVVLTAEGVEKHRSGAVHDRNDVRGRNEPAVGATRFGGRRAVVWQLHFSAPVPAWKIT